ncbi:hypothetical protein SKAU_G00092130 [Synaphobranchus kaupii]|uniref:Uncharacterized protein n=1 Tax=Synaphobranchus kaupii TaxID=118154 RepID=A0A9Q1FWW7_SYNKA|nr:hypothetical protein SKAU_G00092130 [Synaphobranchus kaupii]
MVFSEPWRTPEPGVASKATEKEPSRVLELDYATDYVLWSDGYTHHSITNRHKRMAPKLCPNDAAHYKLGGWDERKNSAFAITATRKAAFRVHRLFIAAI